MDNLGRITQQLTKNANNEVFRTEAVHDSYGQAALQTMPAYTGNQLEYQIGFIRNYYGQPYSYIDFDLPATLNSPNAIQTGINNTLGSYFSTNNTYDNYQANTGNPYTRTEATGAGAKVRVSKPGDHFRMGNGKENYTFDILSGDELKYVFGVNGSNYYSYKVNGDTTNPMNCVPLQVDEPIKAGKRISISPDNVESITYSIGDKVIASCYSGLSASDTCNLYSVTSVLAANGTRCVDIHLPYAHRNSLVIYKPGLIPGSSISSPTLIISITDLYTDKKLVENTDYSLTNYGSYLGLSFNSSFSNLYLNKSFVLRFSFSFTDAFESYVSGNSLYVSDMVLEYSLDYGRFSKNYYDLAGALRKSVSPKGFNCSAPNTMSIVTTYDYDHYGNCIAVKSPDQGLVEVNYSYEGKLRFIQNDEQKVTHRYSYVNYDKHGRPYETGEYTPQSGSSSSVWFLNYYSQGYTPPSGPAGIWSLLFRDSTKTLPAAGKTNSAVAAYTVPAPGDDIPNTYSHYNLYRNFRNGQVTYIQNANSIIWCNRDKLGRPLSNIVQIKEADFVSKRSGIDNQIKTTESNVDYFTGLVNSSTYQSNKSSEYLQYQYSYDVNYRPTLTQLSYGGNTYNLNNLSYNKLGQVSRNVLGNNFQGLDYVYTLNGGLKAMNHPGLDNTLDPGGDNEDYSGSGTGVNKDLFGEIIDYYDNDYLRNANFVSSINSGKYNGLVYANRFKTRETVNATSTGANYINNSGSPIISTTNYKQQELRFEYTYDQFNQLATSVFGTYTTNSGFTQRSEYAETGASSGNIVYDRNGNITRLVRQAYGGTVLDNLTYTNSSTGNQLTSILDAASNSFSSSINFKTPSTSSPSSFNYNAIGQMTASPAEGISLIEYFPDGKIKKITFSNSNTTEYEYGASSEKLKSKFYNAVANKYKYSWYVGPYLYEWDEQGTNAFVIKEARVSSGVIRVTNADSIGTGYLVYHITDHLGNVRVTFTKKTTSNTNGTGIEILSYNDYYAFGGQLPGRSYNLETSRYAFQGKEKSEDGTIWDQFELRRYNHDLGRWFSPDPYGQFSSPYIAMANNPISVTDPDGGWGNLPTSDDPGRQHFRNYDREQKDKGFGIGVYSTEVLQKEYQDRVNDAKEKYLLNGHQRDDEGFIAYLKALNADYKNMTSNVNPIQYDNGTNWLSHNEIMNNYWDIKDLTRMYPSQREIWKADNLTRMEFTSDHLAEEMLFTGTRFQRSGKEKYALMAKGVGREDWKVGELHVTYNTNGTETHRYYDNNGNLLLEATSGGTNLNANTAGGSGSNPNNNGSSGGSNSNISSTTTYQSDNQVLAHAETDKGDLFDISANINYVSGQQGTLNLNTTITNKKVQGMDLSANAGPLRGNISTNGKASVSVATGNGVRVGIGSSLDGSYNMSTTFRNSSGVGITITTTFRPGGFFGAAAIVIGSVFFPELAPAATPVLVKP